MVLNERWEIEKYATLAPSTDKIRINLLQQYQEEYGGQSF